MTFTTSLIFKVYTKFSHIYLLALTLPSKLTGSTGLHWIVPAICLASNGRITAIRARKGAWHRTEVGTMTEAVY